MQLEISGNLIFFIATTLNYATKKTRLQNQSWDRFDRILLEKNDVFLKSI